MTRLAIAAALTGALALPQPAEAQVGGRPLEIEEFLTLDRAADAQISPDGRWVLYTVTSTSLEEDRRESHVWLAPASGGTQRRLTEEGKGGHGGRWSPDGGTVAYVAPVDGTPQIHLYSVASGRTRQLTNLSTGVDGIVWAPTGKHLAFVSEVYPGCPDDACNRRRMAEAADAPSSARIYEELLYRHWVAWEDGRRSHVFVVPATGGEARDVIAGQPYDVPVPPFGGSEDYTFSSDGTRLIYTTKVGANQAWHTNSDIYQVDIEGGEPENLTAAMKGGERHPAMAPDGRYLAFLSQERPGFESDRWRLMIRDQESGETSEITSRFDRSIGAFTWLPNSDGIIFTAQDRQRTVIFSVDLGGRVEGLVRWGNCRQPTLANDGRTMAFVNDAIHRPGQVYVWRVADRGDPRPLTNLNAQVLEEVTMHPAEEIEWVGYGGRTVHGLLVKPPQFEEGARYPLLVLIHGGPQGAWLDGFHSRWNAQLFAAPGYVTVLLNPRGSTGFGQQFVDEISRDWGGKVYTDIMAGVHHAARFPFVDSTRIAAAGGSYGGYMVNWINGHTDRFDALITHAGVYNLESFYGATEELWFPEWEFAGPPWVSRTWYERWSPHRYAEHFRTPTLVLHGALDFRVPDTEGLQMFTALRRRGVPARLVYFPDEGHWIGRPQNQKIWWSEVHQWLARYLQPGATP